MANERTPQRALPVIGIWLLAAVALAMAWHVYETPLMVLAGVSMVALAQLIAWLAVRFRLRWWVQLVIVTVTYLAGATAFSAPQIVSGQGVPHLVRIVTAPVTGWKDLLTLDLPLGDYQAVLAPLCFLFLVTSYLVLMLAWHGVRSAGLAPVLGLVLPVTVLLMGSSLYRPEFQILTGTLSFLIVLVWLVWRSVAARRVSLRRARRGASLGVVAPRATMVPRILTGVAMIALAVVSAAVLTPALVAGETRDVPRTSAKPELEVQRQVSPLSTFRDYRSDDRIDKVLFSVDAPQSIDRVRFATLNTFDGSTMRTLADAEGEAQTEFRRIPSTLPRSSADPVEMTVTVDGYRAVWVPLAEGTVSVRFDADRQAALSDAFFYQALTETGVQLADGGLREGDRIVSEVIVTEPTSLAGFTPSRSEGSIDENLVPAALTTWVAEQGLVSQSGSATGAELHTLIDRLRMRGYLSHSIVAEGTAPQWLSTYAVPAFEPSRAGHSSDRIARLFSDLNSRQAEAGSDASDADLVAAVGDDEQFAVAAALIADSLGFESRVVLGVKLHGDDAAGVPPCEVGVCRGANVTAWLEVRDVVTGEWGAIDVTPQHAVTPLPDVTLTSDPKHHTEVESQHSDTVPPPDAQPNEGGTPPTETEQNESLWVVLWPVIRGTLVGLLALLFLATPLIVILCVKWINTRSRKRADGPVRRVVGGWDEYVDRAIDWGAPNQEHHTRIEYVDLFPGQELIARELAERADVAAFSSRHVTDTEADAYWELVGEAHDFLRWETTWWKRARAKISLRSIRAAIARELR